ncbi:hypothetical protein DES46_1072 [Caldimonas thermodepolymerans]|jgi:hypothetical protein|uniref:Uncharacterized protein n=1 Tax=Caldimonas thermodepolymerans TaxID=215580 RepID=A0AA46DEK2_9BURK|nr:hypothetical protein DES46_1072 [Caldimonas thermodepolymerans]TCP08221.1 hypothetical protein EV676_103254 [Caldimonas thermodepolymerans]
MREIPLSRAATCANTSQQTKHLLGHRAPRDDGKEKAAIGVRTSRAAGWQEETVWR